MFFKMQNFWFCGLLGFFRAEIKIFLSHFFAFSCLRFDLFFFCSVIKKSTKYLWFVKYKQLASYQALIKCNGSRLFICEKSNNAHIDWHHKCLFDWLHVVMCVGVKIAKVSEKKVNISWWVSNSLQQNKLANKNWMTQIWGSFSDNCRDSLHSSIQKQVPMQLELPWFSTTTP